MIAAGTGALAGAVPASAAGGGEVRVSGSQLQYTAVGEDANTVRMAIGETYVWLSDLVLVVPGAGCEYFSSDHRAVRCAHAGVTSAAIRLGAGKDVFGSPLGEPSFPFFVDTGDGDDTVSGDERTEIIHGGPGNDTLHGNGGRDVVYGDAGDDRISGGLGSDLLAGGDGQDQLSGQWGDDLLFGNAGDDVLDGGDDADLLDGGPGENTLDGGNGDDQCVNGPTVQNC
ncbi:hypothetical protein ADL15_41140 [Actinoplanes awajinensis subsp. mycoplanecinus]|uniref:Calcium-binding protein n=1 Tax=Actinoplanes awajinensis subsp. mycoplanecinus TaxID=135947 RepID=A0A101JES7_9ACTN|nr:hypothetical protein ADL15_41140 [Actinoplanes awajinensis subsp. mycoplanecinus]